MANHALLQALTFFVSCISVSVMAAIANPEVADIAPLDSTKTNLNSGLTETKPEVASFTMMERMMKSLKQKSEGPNGLSDFPPLLTELMMGLVTGKSSKLDVQPILKSMGHRDEKPPSVMSTPTDQAQFTSSSNTVNGKSPKGRLTAQSSIADIMAHLSDIPNLGTPTSSHDKTDHGAPVTGSFDHPATQTSYLSMKLKAAVDLLKTSMTTLTAANDIIIKLVTDASELDNAKEATTSVTMIGNGLEPSRGSHNDHFSADSLRDHDKSVNGLNREFHSSHDRNTETKTDRTSSGSRRAGSIVDNRDFTPFESVFGEIVPVPERGQIHNPITKRHLGEKDFVKSGKNSLQPNSKDKDVFSHPVDFPHQAEPYPHLTGNGKSPDMMLPPPPIDMRAFPGSMMTQFESPVPPQHSMLMGGPNPGFNPGPNQPHFGGGPGTTLNRGFMPQGGPRGFMTG